MKSTGTRSVFTGPLVARPQPRLACSLWCVLQAVELIAVPRFQPVVLGLLYHLSMDDKFKSLFTYTECIPRVYEMLIRVQVRGPRCLHAAMASVRTLLSAPAPRCARCLIVPLAPSPPPPPRCTAQDLRNTPELIALAVNLTQNGRNAEVLCEGDRFDRLIRRAFQTCDELAFKVLPPACQPGGSSVTPTSLGARPACIHASC